MRESTILNCKEGDRVVIAGISGVWICDHIDETYCWFWQEHSDVEICCLRKNHELASFEGVEVPDGLEGLE